MKPRRTNERTSGDMARLVDMLSPGDIRRHPAPGGSFNPAVARALSQLGEFIVAPADQHDIGPEDANSGPGKPCR